MLLCSSAFGDEKFLYFVPEGVSPNGRFAFCAFQVESEHDGKDVGLFFARINSEGQLKLASPQVFNQGSLLLPKDSSGPRKFYWSAPTEARNGLRQTPYVACQYDDEKEDRHELAFLRLVDGRYDLDGGYDHQALIEKLMDEALRKAGERGATVDDWKTTKTRTTLSRQVRGKSEILDPKSGTLDLANGVTVTINQIFSFAQKEQTFDVDTKVDVKLTLREDGSILPDEQDVSARVANSVGILPMPDEDAAPVKPEFVDPPFPHIDLDDLEERLRRTGPLPGPKKPDGPIPFPQAPE